MVPIGFHGKSLADKTRMFVVGVSGSFALPRVVGEENVKTKENQNGTARDLHALAEFHTEAGP